MVNTSRIIGQHVGLINISIMYSKYDCRPFTSRYSTSFIASWLTGLSIITERASAINVSDLWAIVYSCNKVLQ